MIRALVMRSPIPRGLPRAGVPAAFACLLAGVLTAQTLPPLPDGRDAADGAGPAWTPPHAAARGAVGAGADVPRLVRVVLARPLFNEGRRPVAHRPGAVAAADGPSVLPRLAGIILAPDGAARAIFAAGADGKPHTVAEGGHLDAWTVLRIEAHAVRVRGPEGERVLPVAYATGAEGRPHGPGGFGPGGFGPGGFGSGGFVPGRFGAAADSAGLPILRARPINLHPLQHRRDSDAE